MEYKEKKWVLMVFHSLMLFLFGAPILIGVLSLNPIITLSLIIVILLVICMNCYEKIQSNKRDRKFSLARELDETQDNTRTPKE
jgi:4-hydroxybenzoate polyprenyltransferase